MRVIEAPAGEDLLPFSTYLWQQKVRHRIFEEYGKQILDIADASQRDYVLETYAALREGRLELTVVNHPADHLSGSSGSASGKVNGEVSGMAAVLARGWRDSRILLIVVAAAVVVFPFTWASDCAQQNTVSAWLLAVPPGYAGSVGALQVLTNGLATGEIWRWFSPAVAHYSVMHIAFNCVIFAELGRRVELHLGMAAFSGLLLWLAATSTLVQAQMAGHACFGGLSGVVYGLLGFAVVLQYLQPQTRVGPRPGITTALLVFLVVFSTGITEVLNLFVVGNASHWGGLAGGVVAGLVAAKLPQRTA